MENIYIQLLKSNLILNHHQMKYICEKATEIFKKEPNVIKINLPITICGNIYGYISDLLEIFKIGGIIPETNYLFLGNYIDLLHSNSPNNSSLEVISLLLCLKILYPKRIILLRGIKESYDGCMNSGFFNILKKTYGNEKMIDCFIKVFMSMPIAVLIDNTIFCVPSGLSQNIETIEEINKIDNRFYYLIEDNIPQASIIRDLIYNIPWESEHDWFYDSLKKTYHFNINVTKEFIKKNEIKKIIRLEIERDNKGYHFQHNNIIISLHSCSNIFFHNNGAILQIDENSNENFIEFNVKKEPKKNKLKVNNIDYFCLTNYYYLYNKSKVYYDYLVYEGVLSLKIKIKNNEYKKKIENKVKNMSYKNQLLFKICCLPENQFFNVIKYSLKTI